MDFFQNQQQARHHTTLMVVLFLLSVVAIVVVLNAVAALIYIFTADVAVSSSESLLSLIPRPVYVVTTLATLAVIAWGSLKRMYELSSGGVAVAEMMDARRVERNSQDLAEQRLLNIVEEMALASGISVPLVYVMDEQRSINAFAAGYSPNEAVVCVTRGTLETLNRDELQGVVAHEFSHILNGDMRLNIHLIGVIAGIVTISALGVFLMNMGSGGRGSKSGDIRVLMFGLALWIIGSIGAFFGNLIKSAISRQREFLADASAVQFTRNPDGIGGALYKIGERGGMISARYASELSHMYIGDTDSPLELFATHPPIEQRIERVMGPGAVLILRDRIKRAAAEPPPPPESPDSPVVAAFMSPLAAPQAAGLTDAQWGRSGSDNIRTTSQAVVDSVGNPSNGHVDYARRVLGQIPQAIREAIGEPEGAKAVLFALVLGDGDNRAAQLALLGDPAADRIRQIADALRPLGPRMRMPLLDLVIATLKVLDEPQRDALLAMLKSLIEADRKVSIAEFVLLTICRRHFGKQPTRAPPVKYKNIDAVATETGIVLSLLAHSGQSGMPAFDKGMRSLGVAGGVLRAPAELTTVAVEAALNELKLLAPLKKPLVIKACLETVMWDGKLTVAEGELMRAVSATLDSPLPPLLDTIEAV